MKHTAESRAPRQRAGGNCGEPRKLLAFPRKSGWGAGGQLTIPYFKPILFILALPSAWPAVRHIPAVPAVPACSRGSFQERGAGRIEPGATRIRDSFTSSPALRAGRWAWGHSADVHSRGTPRGGPHFRVPGLKIPLRSVPVQMQGVLLHLNFSK